MDAQDKEDTYKDLLVYGFYAVVVNQQGETKRIDPRDIIKTDPDLKDKYVDIE